MDVQLRRVLCEMGGNGRRELLHTRHVHKIFARMTRSRWCAEDARKNLSDGSEVLRMDTRMLRTVK